MWVFDATPLIYLAKVDRLGLVQHLDAPCVIPERVHDEVVTTGLEQEYPAARHIEHHVDACHFDVVSVDPTPLLSRLQDHRNLSDADAAVLAHADAHEGIAVMDETYGQDVAASEDITTRGTAYIVLRLTAEGEIEPDEARDVIDAMLGAGWYCAPDVYATIFGTIDDFEA
jgi:predicted nucleic acid-binding protein